MWMTKQSRRHWKIHGGGGGSKEKTTELAADRAGK